MADRAGYDPNGNHSLTAVSNTGNGEPVVVYADPSTHALLVSASVTVTGVATAVKQSDGSQKTQIVDGSGNVIGATSNALDVNIKSGGAAGTQYAQATTTSPATGNVMLGRYESAPSGTSVDGGLYPPLMDNFHQLKVVPVGTVAVSGTFWQSTQPVSIASLPALAAGSALIGKVGIDQTTPGTTNLVALAANQTVNIAQIAGTTADTNSGSKSAGTLRVVLATDQPALTNALKVDGSAVTQPVSLASTTITGAVAVTESGTWTVQPGNTPNSSPWLVTDTPATSGGLSTATGSIGAAATSIKASAGQLYGYHLFNTTAAVAYVQFFDLATGSVTLGTTAPKFSIGIPASGGVTVNLDKGIAFGTAITFACTTTRSGLTGATVDVNFFYK